MKNLEVWCHENPILLKVGRCTHTEPEGLGDEEKEEFMNKQAEDDKVEERFRAINEDNKITKLDAWTSKIVGDTQPYNKIGGEGTLSYSIALLKSNRWPGAMTLSKGGKYCSIYIGDGIKRGVSFYNPTEPPSIEADPKRESGEEPEPNGKEAVEKKPEEEDGEAEDEE